MVRGLLIRQGFIVLDLTLALVLVGTVGMVVAKLFEPPRETLTASYDSEDTKNSNQFVPEVIARSGYDRIVTNRLFGDAGAWDPAAEPAPAPAPEPVEQPIEETPLKLVLLGTTAMSPKDPFGSAVIENQEAGGYVKNFGMGEQIVEDVTLVEVHKREIILLNRRGGTPRQERLSMDDVTDEMRTARSQRTNANDDNDRAVESITLNKNQFQRDLYVDYSDIVTKIKPELYRDNNGRVIGITADNVSDIPVARKLGLRDGDVLQSINNERVDSEKKVMEIIEKYQNASSFRMGIIRNGRPKIISYRLQ